ncbi:MAG: c-type cytochrome [Gemmatimonadales bacterium]
MAVGDSVFHGLVGEARCGNCHAVAKDGKRIGPDLRRSVWLGREASYGEVVDFLAHGARVHDREVPNRPHGGVRLLDDQLRAVSAYVRSLGRGSRDGRPPGR